MPVSTNSIDQIRSAGQSLTEEVSRETFEAYAGLKPTAELQVIYGKYGSALSDEALAMVREEFQGNPEGSDERRSARLLLEWMVDAQTGRLLAENEEREIAWESSATMALSDGRTMPYQRAPIEIANAPSRADRLMVEEARADLVQRELAPLRRERLQREIAFVDSLGIAGDYNGTFEALSGVSLQPLVQQCERLIKDTQSMWDDLLPPAVRASLGISVTDATRADALALFRAPEFDAHFPASAMESTVRAQVNEMGIDPTARGRVIFDLGERAGKRPRAFCAPVRIPDEVYLVMRPHGGQTDWTTLLHELGHAMHFAYTRADYPFEFRWVGDNSVTESYAMLFDHLMQNRGWLKRYTELGRRLDAYLRAAALEELQFLRRYSAKLIYEEQLYRGQTSWDELPDLYVETLSGATTFQYSRADAFVDVDSRYYAVRYLRAWQLGALVAQTLVEKFNEDWYRNPSAGPWIVGQLFGEGQRELAHEIGQRVASQPLSFEPVVKAVEAMLA